MAYEVILPDGEAIHTTDRAIPVAAAMGNGRAQAGFVIRAKYCASAERLSREQIASLFA